jgi:hypothetical protein
MTVILTFEHQSVISKKLVLVHVKEVNTSRSLFEKERYLIT